MRAAVRLQIQTYQLHHPHKLNVGRQQVDLGADQVGDLEGPACAGEFAPLSGCPCVISAVSTATSITCTSSF